MVVIILSACPVGLRGHLTRWLLEIAPGVFVGTVTARIRESLWEQVVELSKDGRALMVYPVRGEQRFTFRVHRHEWEPVDLDGLWLIQRPSEADSARYAPRGGWSKAARRRRAGKRRINTEGESRT